VFLALAGGAFAAFTVMSLPRHAIVLPRPAPDPLTIRGSLHIHTTRSDGTGSVDEVATAAGRAGLHFVVLTDHDDGRRQPDAPAYRSGVLVIDAVEISTTGGHYVALGLGRTPYRLAGEPRDVVDDVTRLGGFGIVAHPDSPKEELRWRDWAVPFEGIEWLNADSEWRRQGSLGLLRALATYWWRGPETIAAGFERPDTPFTEWDTLAQYRRVIGVAGHDAHARIGPGGNWEPGERDLSLRLPGYETAFRTFAVRVRLQSSLSGDAARDAAAVIAAIRAGHVYTALDALATPVTFRFEARSGARTASAGDDLPVGDAAVLEAEVVPAPGVSLVLRRNGRVVAASDSGRLRYEHAASTASVVYRVEGKLAGGPGSPPVPWIVSNPIFIGPALPRVRVVPKPAVAKESAVLFEAGDGSGWRVERQPATRAQFAVSNTFWGGQALMLEYGLAPPPPAGQYAALVAAVRDMQRWTRVSFRAAADAPMRVSMQIRSPASGARWIRSVVVEREPNLSVVPFSEMVPVDPAPLPIPLDAIDSLLFVVDTINTPPGRAGTVWIDDVRLERADDAQVRTVRSR